MGQRLVFHHVNAFSDETAKAVGNPAAICLVKRFPPQVMMEQLAKRLGFPMTSFVRRTKDPHIFDIRHFSPDGAENHVCGHATLAAAHMLAKTHLGHDKKANFVFRLNPKFGINRNNYFKADIDDETISLTMPAILELEEVQDKQFYPLLIKALGVSATDIDGPVFYAPRILNYVVAMKDAKRLRAIQPDFAALKTLALTKAFNHEAIMATARSDKKDYDIMTRVFMPVIDVDEDVVCGSSNCSVIPYWAQHRSDIFEQDKTSFVVSFPYPPLKKQGKTGGVQHVAFKAASQEIVLSGKASYKTQIIARVKKRWFGRKPQISIGP